MVLRNATGLKEQRGGVVIKLETSIENNERDKLIDEDWNSNNLVPM